MQTFHRLGDAPLMAFGTMWQTGWTMVLGFTVSAVLPTVVRAAEMRETLGGSGPKDVA